MTTQSYWNAAREPRYALTLVVPLLLLYEGLSAALSRSAVAGIRNGADVLLKTLFIVLGGRTGLLLFGAALLSVGAVLIWKDRQHHPGPIRGRVLVMMFAESVIYAVLFGVVASALTNLLLHPLFRVLQPPGAPGQISLGTQLVVSLGAGIYEELLFRVVLVSGIAALLMSAGVRPVPAAAVAVVGSAAIFSAFHYVGPYGDPLELPSFTFRFIAGLLFSGLYVARGLGITAWTHALYDIGISILLTR